MAAVKFETNVPVELALGRLSGELVDSQFGGQQYRFTSNIGMFYVSEPVGNLIQDQIRKLGIVAGEVVEICKREVTRNGRKSIQWEVAKIGFHPGEQGDGTFSIGKPAEAPSMLERQLAASIADVKARKAPQAAVAASSDMGGWQQALLAQTNALTDVYAAALAHASAAHGNAVKTDDVRSILLSAFINLAKSGASRAA
jgi:hypothetical protein